MVNDGNSGASRFPSFTIFIFGAWRLAVRWLGQKFRRRIGPHDSANDGGHRNPTDDANHQSTRPMQRRGNAGMGKRLRSIEGIDRRCGARKQRQNQSCDCDTGVSPVHGARTFKNSGCPGPFQFRVSSTAETAVSRIAFLTICWTRALQHLLQFRHRALHLR